MSLGYLGYLSNIIYLGLNFQDSKSKKMRITVKLLQARILE